MSEGNGSYLRFSLEESIWFQKGQEVRELISISLDPNITIKEKEQYVTIEGELNLSGEYIRSEEEFVEEDDFPLSPKFVQTVEHRGEGISEFSHGFPIDITIPHYRIKSIYDINVEVETFDYAFPEKSCLKLSADLRITGLNEDERVEEEKQEEESARVDDGNLEAVSEAGMKEADDEKLEKTVADEGAAPLREQVLGMPEESPSPGEEEANASGAEEKEDLFAPFEAEARKNQEEGEEKESEVEVSFLAKRSENKEESEPPALEGDSGGEMPETEDGEESAADEKAVHVKKKKSKKQGLSIAEFLARKEEEELAKLKVCIVQQGDTIDLLAEKYDVSVHQLLRVNQLELDQTIQEGQVLYIPTKVLQR